MTERRRAGRTLGRGRGSVHRITVADIKGSNSNVIRARMECTGT